MNLLIVLTHLVAAPPIVGLDKVPAETRPLLEQTLQKQLLVGSLEIVEAGNTDDGATVVVREVAGEGGGCRTRLYRAATDDQKVMSWKEVGSDCCDLNLLKCDRDAEDWMFHLHRVVASSDNKAMAQLVGGGVMVRHAALVEGKLKNVNRTLSANALSQKKNRDLLSFGYLFMMVSCVEPSAGIAFQCNADAGGIHMRLFFKRTPDPKRPKAPISTLEGRLLRVEIDED